MTGATHLTSDELRHHPLVLELGRRIVPILSEATMNLAQVRAGARPYVYSQSVGSLTEYQGYDFGIECVTANVAQDKPDNIALQVGLCRLGDRPRIMIDVAWGTRVATSRRTFGALGAQATNGLKPRPKSSKRLFPACRV
jgi:hypothetical protein